MEHEAEHGAARRSVGRGLARCAAAAPRRPHGLQILGTSVVHRVFAGSLAVGGNGGKAGKADSLVREVATHGLTY